MSVLGRAKPHQPQSYHRGYLDFSALYSRMPSAGPQICTRSSLVSFNKSAPGQRQGDFDRDYFMTSVLMKINSIIILTKNNKLHHSKNGLLQAASRTRKTTSGGGQCQSMVLTVSLYTQDSATCRQWLKQLKSVN